MERASAPPDAGYPRRDIERPLFPPPRAASLAAAPTNGGSRRSSTSRSTQQPKKSSFQNALVRIPVPRRLHDGVHVLRVNANGRTRPSFLTLSEDKFTLWISSQKRSNTKPKGGLSLLGLRRSKSEGETEEHAIDIGSIDRVERGQTTTKFELAKTNRQASMSKLTSNGTVTSNTSNNSASLDAAGDATTVISEATVMAALDPKRSFSIIRREQKTLDLMVMEEDQRDDILDALDNVLQAYQTAKLKVTNEVLLLRHIWLDVDKDKTDHINVNELGMVMNRINFYMTKQELNSSYEKFAKLMGLDRQARKKGMNFDECCTFLHKIKRDSWMVKPVNVMWNKLFGELMNNGKPRLTVSAETFLEKFMHKKQKELNTTIHDVKRIFERLHQLEFQNVTDIAATDMNRIDKNRFEAYLLSRDNAIFDPAKAKFDQRLMTKPISEYWINSSHNTYLTGDQFTSESKVDMYLFALNRGCRCVELDVWDGEIEKSIPVPVVWHGHTMTTKIKFADIIKVIKVYLNFHPDCFPIILSFENHCSVPFQVVMARVCVDVLGDRLYIPTESSLFGRLPSPQDLRGMVVIKGRRPDGTIDDDGYDTAEDSDEEEGQEVPLDETKVKPVVKHGIAPQLAKITLFHGTKFANWDQSVMAPTHHMHSFSESKVQALCRQSRGKQWAIYNQSHMTRTFPSGSRVNSSNYNPILAWSQGCQMVALNFQTNDAFLRLNDGRFRENGGCGYVLKPSSLMVDDDFDSEIPVIMTLKVLSGSCLPNPRGKLPSEVISHIINPYVRITLFDVKNGEKEISTTYTTNVAPNNGFFPIWSTGFGHNEKLIFRVENGSTATLQFTVFDKATGVGVADDFIGSASIPILCLREGCRSVQLFDINNTRNGAFDFATLLVDIKIKKQLAEI